MYEWLKCPVCKTKHKHIDFGHELICAECGCVLLGTPPSYVQSRKIKYLGMKG